jgi:hypothetical protein
VPAVKVTEFAVEWRDWWDTLQASWHSGGSGPSHRDCPANADWKILQHGGTNGIFIILMCLSWWNKAMTSLTHREVFDAAVEDVAWALEHVCTSIPVLASAKRVADHSDPGSNKRVHQ